MTLFVTFLVGKKVMLYLLSQLWCFWTLDGNINTDDDDVRDTGSYSNYEGPGQREGQHCVNA